MKLVDGKIQWNSYQKQLRYVPSAFLNPEETVGKEQIDRSLGANSTMTIGEDVAGELKAGENVIISSGKTLKIKSKSFNMAPGSSITIETGGTLIVEGNITGSGTIDATASGATLTVESTGSVDENVTVNTGGGV